MRRSWNSSKSYTSDIDFLGGSGGGAHSPFRGNDKIPNDEFEFINEDGVGYHSPCVSLQTYQGSTSPAVQGRSVREFEEQMATLRKENFNLKLRLYFIEESIPGYHQVSNTTEGQETLMKQLIDSKVEMEILRKEIKEKQQLLQDAARAISHIENLLKDTEIKHEEELNDLKQKLDFYESKYEMDKSHTNSEDLMQRSQVVENLNALQRIRELEDLLRQSESKLQDFQTQIHTLDEILAKRDETIREYEDKVKELVFQNNELLESTENKDKDAANNERSIRGLRSANAKLKAENEKLTKSLQLSQEKYSNEIACMKNYEKKIRDQQEVLTKMESTMSVKTENTARLLERIQDYEKMVNKMNVERKIAKRENQFFRVMIEKLQCYTFEKDEMFQKSKLKFCEPQPLESFKFQKEIQEDYKFKQKLKMTSSCCSGHCCKQQQQQSQQQQEQHLSRTPSVLESNVNFILPSNCFSFIEKTSVLRASGSRATVGVGGGGGSAGVVGEEVPSLDLPISMSKDYLFPNYTTEGPPVRFSISDTSLFSCDEFLTPTRSKICLEPKVSLSLCTGCNETLKTNDLNSDKNCVVYFKKE